MQKEEMGGYFGLQILSEIIGNNSALDRYWILHYNLEF